MCKVFLTHPRYTSINQYIYIYIYILLCFDLLTRPKMPFKVMHRKEVTHSNGNYERKSRGRKLADEMGRAKKFPWYTHRLMHGKRVTSELYDSYFRLMTIKHSISKIEWASNEYITQLSSTSQRSSTGSCRQLEWRCGREIHTRPKGLGALMSWVPVKMLIRCNKESHHPAVWALGLRLSSPGERERHNADGHNFGVKIFQLCSVSSSLSHANLEQPFRTLAIK